MDPIIARNPPSLSQYITIIIHPKTRKINQINHRKKESNIKFVFVDSRLKKECFWREYEYIKNIFESGRYGKLLSGSMTRLGTYPAWSWDGWMMDEKRSGFVPYDLHIHDIDFMVYAFGKPNMATSYRSKRPEQDYINAVYEFDGFFITSEASWYASPYPFSAKFRFQFENAVIANEGQGLKIYERGGGVLDLNEAATGDTGEINLPKSDAYANEIIYFTECVKNNIEPDRVKPDELEAVIDILNDL